MKTILTSALVLGAMTSIALAAEPTMPTPAQAGPVDLTDAQMDNVTAGQIELQEGLINISDTSVFVAVQAICVADSGAPGCNADNRPRQSPN